MISRVTKKDIFRFIKLTGALKELPKNAILPLREDDQKATLRNIQIEVNGDYERFWLVKVDTRGKRDDNVKLFSFEAKRPEAIILACSFEKEELAIIPIELKSSLDRKKAIQTLKKFDFGVKFSLMFFFLNDFQEFNVRIKPILFVGSLLKEEVKSIIQGKQEISICPTKPFPYTISFREGVPSGARFNLSDFLINRKIESNS